MSSSKLCKLYRVCSPQNATERQLPYKCPMSLLRLSLLLLSWSLAAQNISLQGYQKKIVEIAAKVPQFQWLAERAEHHGLKVWLFGGTASSFAHYVKDNMLLELGSDQYYKESFSEYGGQRDYTDIFRPTQDIDLVVDGPSEKIDIFENEVLEKFPDMQGNKSLWEVRPLRENRGEKLALLNNPDFFNQHTDSHSVGLVSLHSEGQVIKDLLDWDSPKPRFLHNVLEGKLHYYHSSKHRTTSRFKRGLNPEIFSVIRYFTKMFQFELEPNPKDLKKIKAVIKEFSPHSLSDSYVKNWLHKNVPKLFLHSKNVEYAQSMLQKVGLRKKLLQVGNKDIEGSPAWWANKSPLKSFFVGRGKGKTAKELGIHTLAHDTSDFFTWSVITRSRKGEANVFVSRPDIVGETAVHGKGFYTLKNSEQGAWQTGYTIKFTLNPFAREGTDFKVIDNIVLILNKNAIRVIPESLQANNLVSYFHLFDNIGLGKQAYLDKAKRNIPYKTFSQKDINDTISFLQSQDKEELWKQWFSLDISKNHPNVVEESAHKTNLLFWAVWEENIPLVKIMLNSDININARSSDGWNPLHRAAANGYEKIVHIFLNANADTNAKSRVDKTPLHYSAEHGHQKITDLFLKAGSDVHAIDFEDRTPLHLAARKGHGEIVKTLLKAGADVHDIDRDVMTPLHYAAMKGREETIKILLKARAKVNAKGKFKMTPLHYASLNGHEESVKALLAAGAKVNIRRDDGLTPLHMAGYNNNEKIMEILVNANADIYAKPNKFNDWNPLHGYRDFLLKAKKKCTERLNKIY